MSGSRMKKLRHDFKQFIATQTVTLKDGQKVTRGNLNPKPATWDENGQQLTKDEFRLYNKLYKQNASAKRS